MMKNSVLIIKIIVLALVLFLSKHLLQAIIEWTDIIPVRPKANVWGNWSTSKYYFNWQFIHVFWAYILAVILAYFGFKKTALSKVKTIKICITLVVLIFLWLLYVYRFEFPNKRLYFPAGVRFNYELLADFIIYSIVGYLLIYSVRKYLIKEILNIPIKR